MSKIEVGVTLNPETNKAYTQEEATLAQFKSSVETLTREHVAKMFNEGEFKNMLESMKEQITSSKEESDEVKRQVDKLYKAAIERAKEEQEMSNYNQSSHFSPLQQKKAVQADIEAVKSVLSSPNKEAVLKANYLRSGNSNSTQAMRLPDIGQIGNRSLALYDLFRKSPVEADSNGVVRYTDWGSVTRGAATVSEAGTIPESTAGFAEYTLNLQKIGDTIPISDEVLRYTSRFEAEINRFLETNVDLVVDTQLLTGNGNAPNLKGVYTSAGTYTAAASGIADANIYDLIVKMSESITSGYGSKYRPDIALMNITDINKMRLKKESTYGYIVPPFASADGREVSGMRIIECNALTANTMIVGDRRFAEIWEQDGLLVSTGLQGTQFAADLITLKVKRYMALLVRTMDETGWKKCTSISAALTTLAT